MSGAQHKLYPQEYVNYINECILVTLYDLISGSIIGLLQSPGFTLDIKWRPNSNKIVHCIVQKQKKKKKN